MVTAPVIVGHRQPVDPHFGSVALLLDCEGSNGGTSLSDKSRHAATVTLTGTCATDTGQKVWGSSSMTSGPASIDDHSRYTLGSGDFTLEFWLRTSATISATKFWYGQAASSGANNTISLVGGLNATAKAYAVMCYSGSSSVELNGTNAISNNTWYHYALCRDGNTLRVFLDGVIEASADVTGITVNDSSYKWAVGQAGEYTGGACNTSQYTDYFRLTVGVARYKAAFTRPSVPFARF